jgi:glycosyltransferase involved in cell wall biosynthesis
MHWETELRRSRATFERLLDIADYFLSRRRTYQAAAAAAIAAHYASYSHPGAFASARLEHLLARLGCFADRPLVSGRATGTAGRRVLHVLTSAKDVGGDTRFVWRWIQRDSTRSHSVALTAQRDFPVPRELVDATNAAHGAIYALDKASSNALDRAKQLRDIALRFDFVALHVYPEDVIPGLAFGEGGRAATIAHIAQADHQFWSCGGVADLVVYLRESGARLGARRRHGPACTTSTLPIPMELPDRGPGRHEARERLGLPPGSVILLTIARSLKYQPIDGPGFAELLAPVLQAHPEALLIAIGPAQTAQWEAASRATGGRVQALGQRSDTDLYYQAADIYVDSYPFTSNTSLLEAGARGLPLVTLLTSQPGDAEVLGAGAPGIDRTMIRAGNVEEWRAAIAGLIADPRQREQLGEETRAGIRGSHSGQGWLDHLEAMYADARGARVVQGPESNSVSRADEIDVQLHRFYTPGTTLGWIIGWHARDMPYLARVDLLRKVLAVDASFSFAMFLPNTLARALARWASGWRQWPVVGRLGSQGAAGGR